MKYTSQATSSLSVAMVVLGIPLIGVSIYGIIRFFHVVFAIITQAAVVAIAYDVWEDRGFVQETEPGEVPAHPAAKQARSGPSSAPRSI